MMKNIPVVVLDATLSPSERFENIPKALLKSGGTLARRSLDEIPYRALQPLAKTLLDGATAFRNPYRAEMAAWAAAIGISRKEALVANMAYELDQACSCGIGIYQKVGPALENVRDRIASLWTKALGQEIGASRNSIACTAGGAYFPKVGNVLCRALDWPLAGLGRHTVIWHHTGNDAADYYSVGWPGYVGVLSANAPGRFAATINQANSVSLPSLQWPPSHLLRWVFDNCEDYSDALETLQATPVCFPAFVMLVGAKPGEAAVVELTTRENRVHKMTGRKPIAIANDYLSGDWRERFGQSGKTLKPYEKGGMGESRRNRMLTELSRRKPSSIEGAIKALQVDWIDNESTMQQMVLNPATGECLVIGLEDQEPLAMGIVGCM